MSNLYAQNKLWRKRNAATWQAGKQRYYRQFEAAAYNRYQSWTVEELELIMDKKYSDRDIAAKIGRSVKAIQVKRTRLKEMKCKRCHDREIVIKSRKLCKKCYDYLRRHNRLGEYPKSDLFRKRLNNKYKGIITKLRLCPRNPNCSLSKISREYKISRERVSQIFEKLFDKKYSICMDVETQCWPIRKQTKKRRIKKSRAGWN